MATGLIDHRKARVQSATLTIHSARFIFSNGTAVIWTEDRKAGTATRVLYSDSATYEPTHIALNDKGKKYRVPATLTLPSGDTWAITPMSGG